MFTSLVRNTGRATSLRPAARQLRVCGRRQVSSASASANGSGNGGSGTQLPLLSNTFWLLSSALVGSGVLYYGFNAKSFVHEYVLGPLIRHTMDAETAHNFVVKLMSYGIFPRLYEEIDDPRLHVTLFNGSKTLNTPVGVAAGLDKNGVAIDSLFGLGFSYVEIGSITPQPQPGNPKPRFFRVPMDEAVINRYGFNSEGHWSVLSNLRLRLEKFAGVQPVNNAMAKGKLLAVNLGKNKTGDEIEDYRLGVSRFGPFADVLVINISSPNTPGLRTLQKKEKLVKLLQSVVEERNKIDFGFNAKSNKQLPPVMVKIAPDLDDAELKSIAESVNESQIDGVIISNTTIERPTVYTNASSPVLREAGGLSGKPLKPLSLKALQGFVKYNKDPNLTIVGCGGISSGKDALEFARAGANFVQLYTAFAYRGPGLVSRVNEEILAELQKEGTTWEQVVATARSTQ